MENDRSAESRRDYLKKQILTYMGNKRKMLPHINKVLNTVQKELKTNLILADGFSGSGIVSRLFKTRSVELYTNDIAGYAQTLNKCFLSTPNKPKMEQIKYYIESANKLVHEPATLCGSELRSVPWVQKYWAPKTENIKLNERVYFTPENAKLIDRYRTFIKNLVPSDIKPYLLAQLLVESSIHNNTNGQFAAFYKENGIGKYGGKTGTDIIRITKPIRLSMPILSSNICAVNIAREDTNEWIKRIPKVDLIYYDPPYNKHPYSIYYFMLDIINEWDLDIDIPDTYRGQPKNWKKSKYNSFTDAKKTFEDLIKNTRSKFILISYNNGGIIPLKDVDEILQKYGKLVKIPIEHKTYNKFKGIASYKRKKKEVEVKEFLWFLDCR